MHFRFRLLRTAPISYKTKKTAKGLAKITQALSLYFAAILFGGAHIFVPLSEQRLVL